MSRDAVLAHMHTCTDCKTCLMDQWAGQLQGLADQGRPTPMVVIGGVPFSLIDWRGADTIRTPDLFEGSRDA